MVTINWRSEFTHVFIYIKNVYKTKHYRSVPSVYCQTTNMAVWEHLCLRFTLISDNTAHSSFFFPFPEGNQQMAGGRPWTALMSRLSHGKTDDLHTPVRPRVIGWWTKQAYPTWIFTKGDRTEGTEEGTHTHTHIHSHTLTHTPLTTCSLCLQVKL